jgi:hypothetical protein
VYTLRGPRQVGKTTLVKLKIRELLKTIPKWNIMYYSFEIENRPSDIITIIDEYLTRAKTSKSRRYIFLDEISNVSNWQKAIKKLKDQGKLDNCTLIATGSHSIDLIHASELLPGRHGISDSHDLLDLSAFQKELDIHLANYLITGGLPIAVDQFLKDGFIKEDVYKIYLDYIKGDLNKNKKDASYVMQMMPNIIKSLTSVVSWTTLQKHTDIGSHNTIKEYVQILSEMFVLRYFYRYNSTDKAPKYDSEKKVYFHDPFFLYAIHGWITQKDSYKLSLQYVSKPEQQASLIENIVSDHVVRLAFNLSQRKSSFDYHQCVFYWKGYKDREVDFVVKDEDSLIPIEIKYQNDIKKEDYYGLFDFKKATGIKNSIVITKQDLKVENDILLIPASLFLLLI